MIIQTFNIKEDLDPVLELWSVAGPGIQVGLSDTEEEIKKKLKRDPDLFLVARQNDRLVGAVLGGFDGRRGMVYHLAIHNESRRDGIGTALMTEFENRLRAKGCLKYYFLVTKDNLDAVHFYEKIGCEMMDLNVMGKVLE
jgi:ribosomal protein S18 acetylase RimI-like enzyme